MLMLNGNNISISDDIWMWLFNGTARVIKDNVVVTSSSSSSADNNNESFLMMDNDGVRVDWDDWDRSLWTPEQRQLLEQGAIPRHVHIALGILLSLIVLFGFTANATILYVFSRFAVLNLFVCCCCQSTHYFIFLPFENRFKRLRTPANVFIINLTICDFLACCLHPLAVYSAFRGRWSFGQTGREREYII